MKIATGKTRWHITPAAVPNRNGRGLEAMPSKDFAPTPASRARLSKVTHKSSEKTRHNYAILRKLTGI